MIRRLIPLVTLICLLVPVSVRAADPESTVSGVGTSTIEKLADTLRLQIDLQVEGANLKEALDKLKARRESVKAGLVKLGASEATLEARDVRTVEADTNSRSAMERMMRERMAGAGRGAGAATSSAPKNITVACAIKIDWPLKGATAEELLIAAATIKDQIKSSKVLDAPKSAAQEELAAEAAAETGAMGEGPAANEPMFMYVAKISDAEQAKAAAEAFSKAKQSAARLAKAAGSELGALRSVNGQGNSGSAESMYSDYYNMGGSSRYALQRMMADQARGGGDSTEAFSAQPGKVTHDFIVQASFSLK